MSNSKLRDIEASVNSFFNSIASNFNMAGYNKDILSTYVPALVYTMYDGYYIYSPYTNTLSDEDYVRPEDDQNGDGSTYQNGERLSGLKPYIFYSCRYKKANGDDFVITYALDNYITIHGIIDGKEVFDYGYLINDCSGNGNDSATYRGISIGTENLKEWGISYLEDGSVETMTNSITGQTEAKQKEYIYTKVNGVKYYSVDGEEWFSVLNGERCNQSKFKKVNNSAVKYYSEAAEFKNRLINQYHLNELKTSDAVTEDGKEKLIEKLNWRRL